MVKSSRISFQVTFSQYETQELQLILRVPGIMNSTIEFTDSLLIK